MNGKRISGTPSRKTGAGKTGTTKADDVASENAWSDAAELDAAAAKASVHEAIGKLIGDDAERRRGTAEKEATGIKTDKPRKPTRT